MKQGFCFSLFKIYKSRLKEELIIEKDNKEKRKRCIKSVREIIDVTPFRIPDINRFLNTGQKSRGIVEEEPFSLIKEIDLKITDEILKDLEKLGHQNIRESRDQGFFPEYYFIKWTDVETLVSIPIAIINRVIF